MEPDSALQTLELLAKHPPHDETSRRRLYEAARQLMYATESRHDLTHRIYHAQVPITVVKVAADLGIFNALVSYGPCTAKQISQHTGKDEVLIARIIRGLASHGLVSQGSKGSFAANDATTHFADELAVDAVDHNVLTVGPCLQSLPACISENGGRNISGNKRTPFHLAFNTDQPPFEWLPSQPVLMKAMIGNMAATRAGQRIWFSDPACFSLDDFTLTPEDVEAKRALVVDVGGGAGQQCISLRDAHPSLRGLMVLQDVPAVIKSLPKDKFTQLNIECQSHDFFQPQPVKGAKVYYLRMVIHDWPDDDCVTILEHVREAMAPDSLLVLDEMVVDEATSNWKQVNFDVVMMSCLGAMERTLTQFDDLLTRSGLKMRDVRQYDANSGDSVIFATRV